MYPWPARSSGMPRTAKNKTNEMKKNAATNIGFVHGSINQETWEEGTKAGVRRRIRSAAAGSSLPHLVTRRFSLERQQGPGRNHRIHFSPCLLRRARRPVKAKKGRRSFYICTSSPKGRMMIHVNSGRNNALWDLAEESYGVLVPIIG